MKRTTWNYPLAAFMTALLLLTLVISSAFAATAPPGTAPAAQLIVRTMPNGMTSPENAFDSKPYTWKDNELQLWGNITYDGSLPLTYIWDFGDGTSATGTVGNFDNIAEPHSYAVEGTPIATLTVTDGTVTASSSVKIAVVPHTADVDKNLAIQRGLKNLYMLRTASNANGCGTYYWYSYAYYGAETGLAVLAFEDYGHRASNDTTKDIYAMTVQGGLDAIFADLASQPASVAGDSDINGNGKSLYGQSSGQSMYSQGLMAMALANTGTPDTTVSSCGSAPVVGMTYKNVLADMVDFIAYAQEKRSGCAIGGWRYYPQYCSSDNSVTQWPVLALVAAEGAPWNLTPPSFVKTLLPTWINYSQDSSGGFGYSDPNYYDNIAKTGAGIIEMVYAGSGGNQASALSFIGKDWNTPNYGGLSENNIGDNYAMYAVKKGLQYAQINAVVTPPLNPGDSPVSHDWQTEYDTWLVANQMTPAKNYPFDAATYADYGWGYEGSFNSDQNWFGAGNIATSFALLIMSPGLVELPPVSVAGPPQEVFTGKPVSFDGSASHHNDLAHHLVKFEWDFNYDGTNFHPTALGEKVTNAIGYQITNGADTQIYTVALRVTDDSVPPRTAVSTTQVTVKSGNVAPVAVPGGPYVCVTNGSVTLDGSKSWDQNDPAHCTGDSCLTPPDSIVSYSWNLGGAVYTGVKPIVPCGAVPGTTNIVLTVTDSRGKVSTSSNTTTTTVAVSNLQPYCYKAAPNSPAYNRITKLYTYTWLMKLQNKGNGGVSKASAAMSQVPNGVTTLDGKLYWTAGIGAGQTVASNASDPTDPAAPPNATFSYSTSSSSGIDLTKITWDFTFTDAAGGGQHFVGSVPQGSLLCQ